MMNSLYIYYNILTTSYSSKKTTLSNFSSKLLKVHALTKYFKFMDFSNIKKQHEIAERKYFTKKETHKLEINKQTYKPNSSNSSFIFFLNFIYTEIAFSFNIF